MNPHLPHIAYRDGVGSASGVGHLGWVRLGTTAWKGSTSCLCVLTSKKPCAFWATSHKQPRIRPPPGSLEENKELEDSPGNETFLHLLRSAAAALFSCSARWPDPPASPALRLLAPRRPQPAAQLGLEAVGRGSGDGGERLGCLEMRRMGRVRVRARTWEGGCMRHGWSRGNLNKASL